MIRNLVEITDTTENSAAVCIVGAGIAGLVLASRLQRHGISVAILESGPVNPSEAPNPLNEVETSGQTYEGAMRGRSRGLGGNSGRWGGQLFPIRIEAIAARPRLNAPGWLVNWDEIERHLPEIETLFGIPHGSYNARDISTAKARRWPHDAEFDVGFSKVPSFQNRNIATLFSDIIKQSSSLNIWLNATVTGFDLDRETGRIKSVTARHQNGSAITIKADQFVLAAGTIESTRLLLALDADNDHRPFAQCEALGRYFSDHISLPLAELLPRSGSGRQRLNAMFAHSFDVASTLRSTRLELSPQAQAADNVACAYGHISMEIASDSGFALLRDFLLARQRSGSSRDLRSLVKMAKTVPYLAGIGYRRYVSKYLHWQPDAKLHLHVVAEQLPDAANRISLSDKRDALGGRVPVIAWRMHEAEISAFRAYMRRFDGYWKRHPFHTFGDLHWCSAPDALSKQLLSRFGSGDIFHPTGSTRMGTDPRNAVVDPNLKTFAVGNMWIGSAAVFPTMSSANPTLTLMQLMLRLGDHLAAQQMRVSAT